MEKLINSLQFHRKLLELSITELSRENVDLISQIEEIESAEGRDSGLLQILKMQQLFLESIISQRQDEMKKFNDHIEMLSLGNGIFNAVDKNTSASAVVDELIDTLTVALTPAEKPDEILFENDKHLISSHKGGKWTNIYFKIPEEFLSAMTTDTLKLKVCKKLDTKLYNYLYHNFGITRDGHDLENCLYFSYVGDGLVFKKDVPFIGMSLCTKNFGEEKVSIVKDKVVDFIETRYEDILKTVEQTIAS